MPKELDKVIFYQMDKAIKAYRQYAQQRLREEGFSVTVDQWIILKSIQAYPDISLSGIAEKIFKDNASVTRMMDLLQKSGFVERHVDPNNRRRMRLSITEKGQEELVGMEMLVKKNRKIALAGLSKEELETAKRVMHTIYENSKSASENH